MGVPFVKQRFTAAARSFAVALGADQIRSNSLSGGACANEQAVPPHERRTESKSSFIFMANDKRSHAGPVASDTRRDGLPALADASG